MRFTHSSNSDSAASNADFLRRYARRLLRDVRSGQTSKVLPVLRRIHAAGVLPIKRLAELYHARELLLLKHILCTLAAELGYANWADCKRDVDGLPSGVLDRFRLDQGVFGDFNQVWFRDETSAQKWLQENGGHLVVYGQQAVVMTA